MRIPLSWLAEYVNLEDAASAEALLDTLIKVGIEEEAIHRPSDELHGPIVVGQVLELEKEKASNGKTINWTQVRVAPQGHKAADGGPDVRGIVCGAHNFVVGDKVVVTLPGAVLPGDFKVSARKTYGHLSDGMIASVRELGIGEDHDGILVLSTLGLDPEVGTDALELLHLGDEAAEVEITPDRGYQLSMRGIGRAYSHATKQPFSDPALPLAQEAVAAQAAAGENRAYPVHIDDAAPIYGTPGVTRFVTRVVENVDPAKSTPPWLASRLRLAGIRSISLPVDISNYVMLELGAPLHFYDADKLQGDIRVRRAEKGEKLVTLDGKERVLNPEDLLITDDRGPIGLAGVMGGEETEVGPETTRIVIESAVFDPVSVARTRRRHKLPSEAAKRYERSVDPAVSAAAAQRAVNLLQELADGQAIDGVTDVFEETSREPIPLKRDYPSQVFGSPLDEHTVEGALTELGAQVERTDEGWLVTPPSWRPDLVAPEDLVEDIAILVGYEHIPARLPSPPAGRGYTREQRRRRVVSQGLANAGLVEVISLPFVSQQDNERYAGVPDAAQMLKLANPISAEFPFLRQSLLPGLVATAKRNISRGTRDAALFETGQVFIPEGEIGTDFLPPLGLKPEDAALERINASLPAQPRYLAGLLVGAQNPQHAWDWADALDYARLVGQLLGVDLTVTAGVHPAMHPGRTARLLTESGEQLGYAGELHPQVVSDEHLPERSVAFEINLSALLDAVPETVSASPISTYPVATQDVALIVNENLPAAELAATLQEGAGELLESIHLFDDYRGQGIEEGAKSLAFGMTFRAPDRTLTADEASEARAHAVALAAERHGATQR